MKKLIAISFSDLHLNNWSKFNKGGSRTDSSLFVLGSIFRVGIKQRVPILFSGDWIHTNESINMELFIKLTKFYDRYSNELKLHVYAISGNHEQPKTNTFQVRNDSYITAMGILYPWFHDIDFKSLKLENFNIHGIPYLDHNKGLKEAIKSIKVNPKEKNILLIHSDYDGARDTDGRIVGSVENLDRTLFRKFNLVLSGHIHKHQKLDKRVYMVGAPYQQRFTDEGNRMGYMEIYDDFSVKFVPIKGMPKFITVESDSGVKEGKDYYRVIPPISKEVVKKRKISKGMSKLTIAKKYMRLKGIKEKSKKQVLLKVLKEAGDD